MFMGCAGTTTSLTLSGLVRRSVFQYQEVGAGAFWGGLSLCQAADGMRTWMAALLWSLVSPFVIHGWCARVDAPKLGWWSTPPKQQISPPARPPTAWQPLPLACQRPRACFSPPAGRPNRLRLRSAFRQSITQSGQSVNQSGSETQHRASPSHVASATCFPFPFAFPS